MNSQVRIRRSRGAVCGAALILLGLWGGLAPFVGPYFHFGFTPDKAWEYNTGRLYLSAVPGAAAVLGGLAVLLTRSRFVAVLGGLLAALGGAWFIAGAGVTTYIVKSASISQGVPLGYNPTTGSFDQHAYTELLALFTGVGALILFAAAVACGRVSILSARDAADAAETAFYPDYQAAAATATDEAAYPSAQFPAGQFPVGTGQFPTMTRYPDSATDPFPEPSTGQFPAATGNFPSTAGNFPPPSQQYTQPSSLPPKNPPFPDAPNPFSAPEAPAQ
jgi:hypothetical protein